MSWGIAIILIIILVVGVVLTFNRRLVRGRDEQSADELDSRIDRARLAAEARDECGTPL